MVPASFDQPDNADRLCNVLVSESEATDRPGLRGRAGGAGIAPLHGTWDTTYLYIKSSKSLKKVSNEHDGWSGLVGGGSFIDY